MPKSPAIKLRRGQRVMKDGKSSIKTLIALPLILGVASFVSFAIYFYSANHAPYKYIDIILVGPVLSFVGMIISIMTRKSRKQYPTLWISGLLACLFGFIICVCIILLLIMIMAAAFNGTWL
jgi:peptidoglycan/LPS O-acetylase OafA/YrhL